MAKNQNKAVAGHRVDLLLDCGHIMQEPVEAAIFLPLPGEIRKCPHCKKQSLISKVGGMYWEDEEQK